MLHYLISTSNHIGNSYLCVSSVADWSRKRNNVFTFCCPIFLNYKCLAQDCHHKGAKIFVKNIRVSLLCEGILKSLFRIHVQGVYNLLTKNILK